MSISGYIKKINKRLPDVMTRDREIYSGRLKKIQQKSKGEKPSKHLFQHLSTLEKSVETSIRKKQKRHARKPAVTFPIALPITDKKDEIVRAIRANQVVIIEGETGSGKSTQIPKMCLEAGLGIGGMIGCTQPRRIAATTIAKRIALELGEKTGNSVGYKIRFKDRISSDSYIKIMTDGILLAETQHDPNLYEYDALIIDEAHERSLNIDFLLGILKALLSSRPELKLIITSATLDTEKFSRAFDRAPILHVGGRMYSVELGYMPLPPDKEDSGDITYVDMTMKAVERLRTKEQAGDILIFMPTEQDIMETCERLEGRQLQGTSILPLFARLSGAEQGRVYSVTGPKIVVATNVAETSLTIPGIKYVIDTGLARISKYLPGTRTTSLPISPISRSSADQRKGRCGRVQNGVCIRLYPRESYESRPDFTPPEIMRSNLAEVILRMISLNLGDIASFPFVDKPHAKSIKDGLDILVELGAIVRKSNKNFLTQKGRIMARMPLDPKTSRIILEAEKEGCIKEVTIIAAALSIQDPRERPIEKAARADQVHAPFKDSDSDFITLLNIWNRYHRSLEKLKTQNKMREFCKKNFLSFPRMREWIYTYKQITTILKEQEISRPGKDKKQSTEALYPAIHRCILSGYLSNIAIKKDKNIYLGTRGREAMIFPGSTLFNKGGQWIVAAEMVKTSRLFARTTANIESQWLETLGRDLCKRSYSHPHWEKKRGQVRALEQVSLFGLPIVTKRPVAYGPINPKEAHGIFVQTALVEGEVKEHLEFLQHNQGLVDKIANLEDKVRRRDILVDESVPAKFYSRNLNGIYDIRTLKKIIKDRGGDDFLKMKEEDLLVSSPDEAELSLYPDQLAVGKTLLECSYSFAPGKQSDGVTVKIPLSVAPTLETEPFEWGIPGLFRGKVTAMIRSLPKKYRKRLVPVPGTVDIIMAEIKRKDQSLVSELAGFIYHRFGVDIPASEWSSLEIPEHLKMRLSITDHQGKEVKTGRDPGLLKGVESPSLEVNNSRAWKKAKDKWEKIALRTWDFGSLPESIIIETNLIAYPGLEPSGDDRVNLRLFNIPQQALESHEQGVMALFALHFQKELKLTRKNLSITKKEAEGAEYFGGVKVVEKGIYQNLLQHIFRKNLRSREEFLAHAEAVGPLFGKSKELRGRTLNIIAAYHQTRSMLYNMENANKTNQQVLTFCDQRRKDLDILVPENFLEIYLLDRLVHIPRYLKGMQIRANRFAYDPAKDLNKFTQIEIFTEALYKITKHLSPLASQERMKAVEDFRWMIEEFKISMFAQELKTPFPISGKRLKIKQNEIERMV